MKRIVLTGANGQVGWELRRTLAVLGEVAAFTREELDLTDLQALRQRLCALNPEVIVNAAAYTAVDAAESQQPAAARINAEAPGVMAEAARRRGALLVHYSTDYVFDGAKSTPYLEDDTPNPLNVYGRTKLDGERAIAAAGARHLIFRTSWVYAARGKNFLRTILRLAAEQAELRIVDDQRGAPTWARLVAEATAIAIARAFAREDIDRVCGTYHLACAGAATWREFAEAIVAHAPLTTRPRIVPIETAEYPTPARRPGNSLLATDRVHAAFGVSLPHWRDALSLCLADMRGQPVNSVGPG